MLILKNFSLFLRVTNGNKFKLVKPKSASVCDANFFVNRNVNIWNPLTDSNVTAESVSRLSIAKIDLIFQTLLYCSSGSLSALAIVSLGILFGIACILHLFSLLLHRLVY
jgi:hypothetical protein